MTVPFVTRLLSALEAGGARPAVVHRDQRWTGTDLLARALRLAARLQRLGLAPGDRVALPLADRLPCLVGHLGVLLAGAVALPINPRQPPNEMAYFLTDSGASFALVDPDQAPAFEQLRADAPALRHVLVPGLEEDGTATDYRQPAFQPDDACLLLYSSGTTGWPKGVVHTQGNLASALGALADCWRMTPDDRVLHVLPLFHIHGLCFAALTSLLAGAGLLLEDGFQPERTMDALADATVFMAVPTIYYRFLDLTDFPSRAKGWTRTRLFTCGSAPIRPEVLPTLEAALGRPVINRYGMTEAHVITSLPLDGPWPAGSVGTPLPGVEVEVRDEVGAVWVRGPNLFRGYWGRPEAFAGGWFETGDLGTFDSAGFLTLVGRKHDLIITSGFNVYPAVVERVLGECPGVREVVVVGVPDARKGERVAAFLVRAEASLDTAAVEAFCRERLIDYQRPRDIVFVDELPRNAMGKVLRRDLRDRLAGG